MILKLRKLDLPAFTQVIGPITFGFSAKSFCRLQVNTHKQPGESR
jgi:hypothetical protein